MKTKTPSTKGSIQSLLKRRRRFFYDEEALVIDDPDHSGQEERFIILGMSTRANLLVVCHCYRQSETVIRIISARKATRNEAKQYDEWK